MQIALGNTTILLLPEKAMFLPEHSILVIADLHLGKTMHFRKAGLFLPPASGEKDYEVLHHLIERYEPREVWFLGDLFHSDHNVEWQQFEAFVRSCSDTTRFVLIQGNHDILPAAYYDRLQIEVITPVLEWGDLVFSHEPLETVAAGKINIAGHIHPGCAIRGLGRQSMRLPCFYRNGSLLLLPAFGTLTGLKMMEPLKEADVFAIAPDHIFML
jgi:uncharacterized protein